MGDLRTQDVDSLASRFFEGEVGGTVNDFTQAYSRQEICSYLREKLAEIETEVEAMSALQLAYRPPGAPTGPDMSGDEAHFDTSEIVTHLASGVAFHWGRMARALGLERPDYPKPPEGVRVTGTKGNIMGAGGWSGISAADLLSNLREVTERFVSYVEALPPGSDFSATTSFGPFRDFTAHSWLFLDAVHFGMHLNQIRAMKAQPDFPAA